MKNIWISFLILLPFFTMAQIIEPAPSDSSAIYFVRSSKIGDAVDFIVFDSAQVVGKLEGKEMLRYTCAPGSHLIWIQAENRVYVEAQLQAGKLYVIDILAKEKGLKVSVELIPINSPVCLTKETRKFITKNEPEALSPSKLAKLQKKMKSTIKKGLKKYPTTKPKKILNLEDAPFVPEDIIYVKKKNR